MRTIAIVMIAACASQPVVPAARFAVAPPVEEVDDDRPIREPAERNTYLALYHFDGSFYRPLMRTLEVSTKPRAEGVNAIDEVPNSTWFTNRIGVRDLTIDELRAGPNTIPNPQTYVPWKIHKVKSTGESLGFTITDSRNERFLVKFDRVGFPELETANHVIAGRIMWACGYNVPEDFISHIRPEDLVIAPDATRRDEVGRKQRIEAEYLRKALAAVEREPNGTIRVLASRMLPGKPIGGHLSYGRRTDDPNDRIPHELRRDLRGAEAIFAWLDHGDAKEDNTLDVWTDAGYVVHYFLDFGKALGGLGAIANDPRRGYEYRFDFPPLWGSLISLGAVPRTFVRPTDPNLRGIGFYDGVNYKPSVWRADTPAYTPFLYADHVDWFWGAKILIRFTREQLAAIVDVGQLSDRRAREYLIDTLVARQRATALYAFGQVAPLDHFELKDGTSLCFEDLLVKYKLTHKQATYEIRTFDRNGRALGGSHAQLGNCTPALNVSRAKDGYTIVRIDVRDRSVFVHVARDRVSEQWHVVGVYRP